MSDTLLPDNQGGAGGGVPPADTKTAAASQPNDKNKPEVTIDDFTAIMGTGSDIPEAGRIVDEKKADERPLQTGQESNVSKDKVPENKDAGSASKETVNKDLQQKENAPNADKQPISEEEVEETVRDIRSGQKDLSDIPEEHHKAFKRMSQKTFELLKPIYLEHKAQKEILETQKAEIERIKSGAIPDNYYEHERGYTLTPEFEQAATRYQLAGDIVSHWEQQLARVRAGEDTYQKIFFNNGELILGDPTAASKSTEAEILKAIALTRDQFTSARAKLEALGETHKTKVAESVNAVRAFEDKSFPVFTGEQGKKLEPLVKDTINKIVPPAFRNNPLASGYAKAIIMVHELNKQLQKLKSSGTAEGTTTTGKTATGTVSADAAKAGPTNSNMGTGGGEAKGKEVSYDDFQEVMSRRS